MDAVPVHSIGVNVGQVAPEFALQANDGSTVKLSELCATGPVVLVFFPFAFTGVCRSELRALEAMKAEFAGVGATIVAISCDSPYSLQTFAEAENLTFTLLSDFWPHGEVAQAFDVFLEDKGFATRGTFILDQARIVRWSLVHGPGVERDPGLYLEALQF
jgi:peroxiredoxin